MRLHLLGPAHIHVSPEVSVCAFAQRMIKFPKMMGKDYEIFLYALKGSIQPKGVTELIEIDTGYTHPNWRTEFFQYEVDSPEQVIFNGIAARDINKRKQDGDLLLISTGRNQKPIASAVKLKTVEFSIGYGGVLPSEYMVFQSRAWMHYVYGWLHLDSGNWLDAVIPNFFDPDDFLFRPDKLDYFLYMGRVTEQKGVGVAIEVARKLGTKLLIAGQCAGEPPDGYVGCMGPEDRKHLLSHAKAVFVPTLYIEPFGGVAVEAMLSGTPVITSDWGAFPETVVHGTTGYRCRTVGEFIQAARRVDEINPIACREWATRYSMDRVRPAYHRYFQSTIGGKR